MKVLAALLLVLIIDAVEVRGQEPRLPAPAATPSESEALILRARALSGAGNYRESAAAWQTIGSREPSIASLAARESIRALIAAGDIEPALKGLSELGSTAPAELLLRGADACRAARTFDCAASLYRRARQSAGRSPAADEAAIGLARSLEQAGQPREALETYRELQLTFREAAAFEVADQEARRLTSQLNGADPLTESDFESIVDRLAGVAAFRRAVDMQAEWLKSFPATPHREEIESAMVGHLYSLRANDEARARAADFLKQYPASIETGSVFITLFRLDVREGRSADVEKRGRAIMAGGIDGTTLRSLEDLGGFETSERRSRVEGLPAEWVRVAEISASGFQLARVPPFLGRWIAEADEQVAATPVVVIGYDVWQSRFASDRAVIGQTVRLGEIIHTVVGVMPEGFAFPVNHRYWIPLRSGPDGSLKAAPEGALFARLAPGVTLDAAQAELTTASARTRTAPPSTGARAGSRASR